MSTTSYAEFIARRKVKAGTMSTATSGRAREYKVRDALISHGWELIARSAASKGPADLIMAHEEYGAALIQVGTHNKRLGPSERARLLHAAWLCSALPIVATVSRGQIFYALVHDGIPSDWEPWTPDTTIQPNPR